MFERLNRDRWGSEVRVEEGNWRVSMENPERLIRVQLGSLKACRVEAFPLNYPTNCTWGPSPGGSWVTA